jgi:hypothetical protein
LRPDGRPDESTAVRQEPPVRRVDDGALEAIGTVIERDQNLADVGTDAVNGQSQFGRRSRAYRQGNENKRA